MNPIKIALALLLVAFVLPVFAEGEPKHGGQVVEVQDHQFELVVEPEAKSTHLDLFISDPKNKPVTTAVAKLQILAPNGQKATLPLKYGDGHYTAVLNAPIKGEYRVVVLTSVGGKKLNSRFSFKL